MTLIYLQLWFHYGPAQLVDLVYRLMGKKPFLVKISSMMQKSQKALEPFTTNSWEWSHGNMDKLWQELGEEDRDIFPFDIRDLDWIQFLETYVQVNRFNHDHYSIFTTTHNYSGNKKISIQREGLNHPRIKETSELSLVS